MLVTSREGLGVAGERIVAVASLALPESTDLAVLVTSEAGRLFVERTTAAKAGFEATDENASTIAEIVRRLDGIPLAIELAAARVTVLSPAQIAQRLDDRFRLLAGGERGAVERSATLRATIDWSYEMLTPEEQQLHAAVSVCRGMQPGGGGAGVSGRPFGLDRWA